MKTVYAIVAVVLVGCAAHKDQTPVATTYVMETPGVPYDSEMTIQERQHHHSDYELKQHLRADDPSDYDHVLKNKPGK